MPETILKIRDLQKSFGDNLILQGLSLDIKKGEVVVIDENFGVRITEIVSPLERAARLQ